LFPFFVAASARWFKNPEIIVRLPSIIIGLLTIWFVYRFVKELSERKTALMAALFLAVFPWHIIQSRVGVNVILTPCFGALLFLLFTKAVKKQSYKYLYLSFFVLGISAFWTYTESQVFVILGIICCIAFIRELAWVKTIDIINCIFLFIIPLYPFWATWDKANFVQGQYYYSAFLFHKSLTHNIVSHLRDVFKLLFLAKNPFTLFAPGLKGPIIPFFLLLPLAFGTLNIRKNRIFARIIGIWLIGGIFFSVCFINHVEDRYFIAVAPAISILIASGIVLNKSRKLALLSTAAAIIGIWIYGSNYFSYLNNVPLESLKAYGYGSQEVAEFLSGETLFMRPNAKAVIEWGMSPAEFYFIFAKRKNRSILEDNYLNKFIAYWQGDDIPRSQDIIFYCLWSPESREHDWYAINCQLYKKFRLLYPEKSPIKNIYYPNGKKAIEIFKIVQ
jgi:4-amino-4-deoxy-L-arabinose transferase-like glycosyltransferase